MKQSNIIELNETDIEQVNGGAFWVGAFIGAASAGASTWANGGSAGQIASSAALGAVSGIFGSVAALTSGAVRVYNGVKAVGAAVASGAAGGGSITGGGGGDFATRIKAR